MNNELFYVGIFLVGVLISSFAQIVLKKSAVDKHTSIIKEYLNFRVIFSYATFFLATLFTVYAYKYVPLSMGPILSSTEYIFIAVLSVIFLKEKISLQKQIGLFLVLSGVIIAGI